MRGVARTCLRRAREKEGEERAWGRGRGGGVPRGESVQR